MMKGPVRDVSGRPLVTLTNESNPWWSVFEHAIISSGGKLAKPEILSSTTDARFVRQMGIPALGFSPMINTPILLHDHNEVVDLCLLSYFFYMIYDGQAECYLNIAVSGG
jgi:amidohydrolase/aminoacylase